ncbi:MAG: ATP-binding cassette domain-containing protein, partial [Bacteroidales bacterium]|nr:ATP-binding cassette domain-containing protein [Bacteroidales bacterium]
GLAKHFGQITAVEHIDLTVYKGDIYGFLGPNGSGKSTTIRMILNLISPDQGEVFLFGEKLNANRRGVLKRVGALIERPDFYNYLTAYQNLDLLARYSGLRLDRSEIMEKLELVDLHKRFDSKVRTFSQGMKQRLGIAQTLLHDPDLIILDEPVNGLDPQGIKDTRNLIIKLNSDFGKTLIVSSHILREMELIANRMVVISKGKVVVEGEVRPLLDSGKQKLILVTDRTQLAMALLKEQFPQFDFQQNKLDELEAELLISEIPKINKVLVDAGIGVKQLISRNSLEDYFLQVT